MSEASTSHLNLPAQYQLEEYQILEVLGEGGFGVTYKAMDNHLQRLVAIKEYLPGMMAVRDPDLSVHPRTTQDEGQYQWGRQRFLDEARTLAQFRHPAIVSVVRLFEAHGTAYIVMEYEKGQHLGQWLKQQLSFPAENWLINKLLLPMLDGLEKVHAKGILHRDIKPSNIYIRDDETPVLLDFGSARQDLGQKTQMLTSVVTAGYSPLEQYGSAGRQGPWTDLYALGGTLYYAMTGKKPPDAVDRIAEDHYEPVASACKGRYSELLCHAIDQSLMLKAEQRPQSVAEFRQLLQASSAPTSATATTTTSADDATRLMEKPPQTAVNNEHTARRDDVTQPPTQVSAVAATAPATSISTAPQSQAASAAPNNTQETTTRSGRYFVLAAIMALLIAGAAGLVWWLQTLEQNGQAAAVAQTQLPAAQEQPQQPASTTQTVSEDSATEVSTTQQQPTASDNQLPPAQPLQEQAATQDVALNNAGATDVIGQTAPSEDDILHDWELSDAVREARKIHITGTLLAYIRSRQQFDSCLAQGCSDMATLKQRLDQSRTSPWQHDGTQGSILVESGAKTTVIGCTWRLNVEEDITSSAGSRKEQRTYCTTNGLDRKVETATAK